MNPHLSDRELQEYAQSSLHADRRAAGELHLSQCEECRGRLRSVREFEKALREVPLEQTSAQFTERIMRRIGISETPSFAWIVFRNLAPLCALTLIGGILYVVLDITGAIKSSQVQQSIDAGKSLSNAIGGAISGWSGTLNLWLQKYFSFAFATNVYALTTFLVAFFGAIALLDKYIFSPMMRRKV